GVTSPNESMRLSGNPIDPRVIEFLRDGQPTVQLSPNAKTEIVRFVTPGKDLVTVKAAIIRQTDAHAKLVSHVLSVKDAKGSAIPRADVQLNVTGEFYGNAIASQQGTAQLDLPPGTYETTVTALARGSKELPIDTREAGAAGGATGPRLIALELPVAPR